jgi:Secretion system C-terminal sorting domain
MLSKKITIISILFLVSLALIGQNPTAVSILKKSSFSKNSQSDNNVEASELSNFSADIKNENVLINWDMNNVNDVLGFELYKSSDGSGWEMIGFVGGDEATGNAFSFVDETPNWGINFYRLKSLNKSGEYGFLRTTKIVFEYTTGADVGDFFPNPSTNGITNLNINIPDGGAATIYIHDSMGKLVGTYQKMIESGADTISFNLSDLSYGIFYAKISVNRESYTKKIMLRMSK